MPRRQGSYNKAVKLSMILINTIYNLIYTFLNFIYIVIK